MFEVPPGETLMICHLYAERAAPIWLTVTLPSVDNLQDGERGTACVSLRRQRGEIRRARNQLTGTKKGENQTPESK